MKTEHRLAKTIWMKSGDAARSAERPSWLKRAGELIVAIVLSNSLVHSVPMEFSQKDPNVLAKTGYDAQQLFLGLDGTDVNAFNFNFVIP